MAFNVSYNHVSYISWSQISLFLAQNSLTNLFFNQFMQAQCIKKNTCK